ncbi:hypothetical protein M8494_24185 [Serratia ureilytica]
MPKRTDIKKHPDLGAGPIVIGQACEFDYQVQVSAARRGLPRHSGQLQPGDHHDRPGNGRRDLHRAIHWEVVRKIIEKERPDAVLPTTGGQTALNCALELERQGVLAEFGVTMIGATADAIDKAEDRRRFDVAMKKIGLDTAFRHCAHHGRKRWRSPLTSASRIIRPFLYHGRHRRRHRLQPRRVRRDLRTRPGSVTDQRAADR